MPYDHHQWVIKDKVMLYRRAGSPKWQMRLKVPDGTGYLVRSTKEADLSLAEEKARLAYSDLLYRTENNLVIQPYDFRKLYEEWWKREKPSKGEPRIRYIEGTTRRYLLPYFYEKCGRKPITAFTDTDFDDYFAWRLGYWDSEQGQANIARSKRRKNNSRNQRHSKKGNVAKRPSNKSLQMEQSLIKQIFWWGIRRGIINRVPYIKAPRDANTKNLDVARRPTFTVEEYRQLYRAMRRWVKEEPQGEQRRLGGRFAKGRKTKRPHSLHIWQRQLLRNYVLFMANSGLRPNEARQLRWRDLHETPDGVPYIYVRPATKTGERECFPRRHAFSYLERIRQRSLHTDPDDLVFANQDGEPIQNFGKTFAKLLEDNNLTYDANGKRRTIYSLRHFYATQCLEPPNPLPMDVLASNLGTSPEMVFRHYRHNKNWTYRHMLSER